MNEEERKRLFDREVRQRIPAVALKYVQADEVVMWFWVNPYYPSPKAGNKPVYGQMTRVFLDNKDGGRVLRHWIKPEKKGIFHNEPVDEWVNSYRLRDVYNVAEDYLGDFGSHVETSGSTYGTYAGWDGSGVGSVGGETHSQLVQHNKALRLTIGYKSADGNVHQDVFEYPLPSPEAEQRARFFWNTVKKRCELIK